MSRVRVEWRGDEYERRMHEAAVRGVARAAQMLRDAIVRRLTRAQPRRVYSSGRVVGLDPSAPGTAPKIVTGALRKSYAYEVDDSGGTVEARVGTNISYAPPLEFGTSRMAARPHVRPSLEALRGELERTIRDELRRAAE